VAAADGQDELSRSEDPEGDSHERSLGETGSSAGDPRNARLRPFVADCARSVLLFHIARRHFCIRLAALLHDSSVFDQQLCI